MKNFINFFGSKQEINTENHKKYYRTGEFYKYEVTIQEKLDELKKTSNDMLYQAEKSNIFIGFYKALFNVSDKIAIEIHNGNYANEESFITFFEFLSDIYLNMIDLSKQKDYSLKRENMIKISDSVNKEFKITVNEYVKIRDSIDSYVEKLTDIFNKSNDENIIEFAVSEQYELMFKFYEKIIDVAKKIKDEIENGTGTNTGTMYFIMLELEKIVNNLSNEDNNEKSDDIKVMEYKDNQNIDNKN